MLLRALVKQKGKQYSALCPELDISADGNSPAEARKNLGDAVHLYLETLCELDDRQILRIAPPKYWHKFFEQEDVGQGTSNISFYSVVIKEDGSRVLQYPFRVNPSG